MVTFGERLRRLRIENDLTQEQLGKILNVLNSSVSLYETNKRHINYKTMKLIADYFNVSIDYLYGRTNIKNHELLILDEELQQLLNDRDTLVAFRIFLNLSAADKQEIINYIKYKNQQETD